MQSYFILKFYCSWPVWPHSKATIVFGIVVLTIPPSIIMVGCCFCVHFDVQVCVFTIFKMWISPGAYDFRSENANTSKKKRCLPLHTIEGVGFGVCIFLLSLLLCLRGVFFLCTHTNTTFTIEGGKGDTHSQSANLKVFLTVRFDGLFWPWICFYWWLLQRTIEHRMDGSRSRLQPHCPCW